VVTSWLEISDLLDRCCEPQLIVQVAAQWTLMRCMMPAFTNLTRLLLSDFAEIQSRGSGGVGRLMPLLNASVFLVVMSYVADETVAPPRTPVSVVTSTKISVDTSTIPIAAIEIGEAELDATVVEVERREKRLSYVRVLLKGVLLSVVDAILILPARGGDSRALVGIHIMQLLLQLYTFKWTGWRPRSLCMHAAIVAGWLSWHALVCGVRTGDLWAAVATWLIFLS
jgi:hypothetical protein